jgi:hypothetical protein
VGALVTADRAMAAFRRLPLEELPSPGARFVLFALCTECDAEFSCVETEQDLRALTGYDVATIRRHLGKLAEKDAEGRFWIERRRTRNVDGTLGPYRTWLGLEKLRLLQDYRANCAVVPVVDKPVDEPPRILSEPPRNLSSATAHSVTTTAQNARSLRKYFLLPSFLFKDDHEKELISRILDACGPGLVGGEESSRPLTNLARDLDRWIKAYDLEQDILPVVRTKTARRRQRPLMDLRPLEADILVARNERMARLRAAAHDPESARRQKAVEQDRALRAEREELASDIARYERGDYPCPPPPMTQAVWHDGFVRMRERIGEIDRLLADSFEETT